MLIRYPGSKDRHLKLLRPYIDPLVAQDGVVVEPFAGTAAVTFDLLARGVASGYVLGDVDESMIALWTTVRDQPNDLIRMVHEHTPTVEDFYEFRENPGSGSLERAFRKVVLHQTSYSGLGAVAGSPIGGRNQTSAYTVDCRWSPNKLTKDIRRCADLLARAQGDIVHGDWSTIVERGIREGHFIYLDPPYIDKGSSLYLNGVIDHAALANTLHRNQDANWLVSYDDSAQIAPLYDSWADVTRADVRSHLHHKTITDVIIRPGRIQAGKLMQPETDHSVGMRGA